MLLEPLRNNAAWAQTSTSKWIEAPTAGWNAKNDLSDMKMGDAVILDNMNTVERGVRLRDGYSSHVTGITGPIRSLMEYSGITGTNALFAATATDIYNVTSAGAVGAAVVSTLSSGAWQHTMFSTAGGKFLVIANGADDVRNWDGSSWTTPSITGATSANLITVTAHMSRLWFAEKNTLKVWYLPANAIAGAATAIDFGPLSRRGGYLVGMVSWTRDGGAGIDDVAVFVTSKGEAHVYAGTDPASSATWDRVGTFVVPEPIGRRCFVKSGSDVGILTSQGLVPLSNVLPIASSAVSRVAATEKIGGAFQQSYEGGKTFRGWQCLEWPKSALAIVNVPQVEGTTLHQYVVSTTKGGWSRWTGVPAECWSLLGDRLFFGSPAGTIYEMTGQTDDGEPIDGVMVQAFSELGSSGSGRSSTAPIASPTIGVRLDYDDAETTYAGSSNIESGSAWDVAPWDTSAWSESSTANAWWQACTGTGFAVAIVVRISSSETVTYNGSRLMYSLGHGT